MLFSHLMMELSQETRAETLLLLLFLRLVGAENWLLGGTEVSGLILCSAESKGQTSICCSLCK